jgi:uncharacterized ferredoxin-like protein
MNSLEKSGLETVAKLMALSARTAPKTGGIDHVHSKISDPDEQLSIADMMLSIGEDIFNKRTNKKLGNAIKEDWASDARTITESGLLMLVGVEGRKVIGLNCGGCGFPTCSEMLNHPRINMKVKSLPGPYCIFKVMDLSIASASAVKTAMEHNVDNRMMYKVGVAALKLGMLPPCDLIIGIPLSATGKNIYFDRADKLDAWKILAPQKQP